MELETRIQDLFETMPKQGQPEYHPYDSQARCDQRGTPWIAATMAEVAEQWTSIIGSQAYREKP